MANQLSAGPHSLYPFHLAFPVQNLTESRLFYGKVLGCEEGRSSNEWIDFNLYGHQIVAHLTTQTTNSIQPCSLVDGHQVPVRHFGIVLPYQEWLELSERLRSQQVHFLIEPCLRFKDSPGEQYTFFIQDPSGNVLEFKSMSDPKSLFARFT